MKTAYQKNQEIKYRLAHRGIEIELSHANTLRRAELTLHRWCELECGDSNDYQSWAIERDEKTNRPSMVTHPYSQNKEIKYPVSDRETTTLKRIATLCKELNLHFFYQSDPRGCALYVAKEPLTDTNYTNGIHVSI